jgi:hypothetical protein
MRSAAVRRSLRGAGLAAGVAAAASASAPPAAAAPIEATPATARRVVLLFGPRRDPVVMRLRAEILSLGFVVEAANEGPAAVDVEATARGADAVAAIQVDRAAERVTVWMPDRASGRMTLVNRLAIEPDPAVVAFRAAEALRTSLIDVGALLPERPASPPRSEETRTEEARASRVSLEVPPSPFGASLGAAVAANTGRIGTAWQLFASAHWMPKARIGAEAMALVPLTVARWREAEGSTSFTFGLLGLGARFRPVVAESWSADVGGGIGAALVHGEGVPAAADFSGNRRDTLVAAPYLRVGTRVALAPSFWLRADLAMAVAFPRIVYTVAARTQETWGWPLLVGSIGLEVGSR